MTNQPEGLQPTVEQRRQQILNRISEIGSFRQIVGITMVQIQEISKLINVDILKNDKNVLVDKVDFIHLGRVAAGLTQDITQRFQPEVMSLLAKIDAFERKGKTLVDAVIAHAQTLTMNDVTIQAEQFTTEGSLIYGELQDYLVTYNALAIPSINEILKTINNALVAGANPLTYIQPIQLNAEG